MDGGVPAGRCLGRRAIFEQRCEPDETSAVDVSGQHLVVQAAGVRAMQVVRASGARRKRGTSSNVVISREKFSSNLRV